MSIFKKESAAYSIFNYKCPRCHEGELFLSQNAYDFKNLGDMPSYCKNCNQDFSPEPGFYFGSSYVSYGFAVAAFAIAIVCNWLFLHIDWMSMLIGVLVLYALLVPVTFRLSRTIWIHFFYKYDPTAGPDNLAGNSGRGKR